MDHQRFVMVSEWMENGNINEFVKAHEDINRFELVRLQFYRCSCPPLKITPHSS